MAVTPSTMLPLGTQAPDFELPDTKGNMVKLKDFKNKKGLLVIFMCNHCPFVKHVLKKMVRIIKDYQANGIATVGINSNDVENYPDDNPEKMAQNASENSFTFPYLYDEDQSVARSYKAACTPDFFLFDRNHKLIYRGQMDESRPGNDIPITGSDLTNAMDALLEGKAVNKHQKPSMGCNIKWKPGNEPVY
jgi:peroxiredoxin